MGQFFVFIYYNTPFKNSFFTKINNKKFIILSVKTNKQLYESIMSSVAKQVKKALNESAGDGWDLGDLDQLEEAFNEIERFMYEVRNCVRGAYSDCYTYAELAEKLRNIAESLAMAADEIENTPEPELEDEEEFEDGEYDE